MAPGGPPEGAMLVVGQCRTPYNPPGARRGLRRCRAASALPSGRAAPAPSARPRLIRAPGRPRLASALPGAMGRPLAAPPPR